MLVLTRRPGQAIMIGDDIAVGVRQLPGEAMTLTVSSRHPLRIRGDPDHLRINDSVDVRVLARTASKLRVGIECPRRLPVFRAEVYEEIHESLPTFETREPIPLAWFDQPELTRWFTRDARRALAYARADAVFASSTGAPTIGSGYILLGLLEVEEGVAAGALGALDVSAQEIRARLARLHDGDDRVDHRFSARARKILELAHRQALALGDDRIDTEHLLLALLRAGEGDALRILADMGVSHVQIRDEIVRELLDRGWRPPRPGA
jgi:sRNA-binding carbon storage regulator CsrA